jgi:drug/metabolite transporter (DMT)-like permease
VSTDTLDPPLRRPGRVAGTHRLAYLLMLGSAATFASMGACTHALNGRCDWRITALARAALAFVMTTWLARASGARLLFWRPGTLWMRSIVGSVSLIMSFYALSRLHISTAYTLFNTFPLWVTLFAWPVLGERPTVGVGLALLSGALGVALIEDPQDGGFRLATIAALLAAVCTAVVMLGLHRLRYLDPLAIVVHFSGVATAFALTYLLGTVGSGIPLDLTGLAQPTTLILLLGVGGFASIGQIAMTRAFSLGPPQRLAVVGLAQVVFALGFDFGLWGRTLGPGQLAGTLLVLAPVAWLVSRRRS